MAASSEDRHKAAFLVAKGASYQQAAEAVGRSKRTISRWAERPEWQAEVARLRAETPPSEESADAVLAAALGAVKPGGAPDWTARIAAAKLIKSLPAPERTPGEGGGVITIYLPRPEGDDASDSERA